MTKYRVCGVKYLGQFEAKTKEDVMEIVLRKYGTDNLLSFNAFTVEEPHAPADEPCDCVLCQEVAKDDVKQKKRKKRIVKGENLH